MYCPCAARLNEASLTKSKSPSCEISLDPKTEWYSIPRMGSCTTKLAMTWRLEKNVQYHEQNHRTLSTLDVVSHLSQMVLRAVSHL
jgi:hypothetical protein